VSGPAARVGRDGALSLAFRRRGMATILAASRSILPLQVMAPLALEDAAAVVSILNPTGGIVGGDRFTIDVDVEAGADACLTTPSASRIYRAAGEPAEQVVRLRLGPGASLEWVPDHGIPFAGAAFRQVIDAEVGEGATLVLVDAWAAGRVARGEEWRFARLDSALTARDGAGWLVEALHEARAAGTLRAARLTDLLARVLERGHPVRVVYSRGGWVNVNDLADLVDASGL